MIYKRKKFPVHGVIFLLQIIELSFQIIKFAFQGHVTRLIYKELGFRYRGSNYRCVLENLFFFQRIKFSFREINLLYQEICKYMFYYDYVKL